MSELHLACLIVRGARAGESATVIGAHCARATLSAGAIRACHSGGRPEAGDECFSVLGVARPLLEAGTMSAIPSLLRVMTLRDAEAIILEAGKIPSLRRRGQIEALAMPALEGRLLDEFAAPLTTGRTPDTWPASVAYVDPDGASYQVTIDRTTTGLRIVARKGKPPAPAPMPPASTAEPTSAWWASRPAEPPPSPAPAASGLPAATVEASASAPARPRGDALPRLAHLLGPAIAHARDRGASDVIASTGQPVRIRSGGHLETLELELDDRELAASLTALGSNTDHSFEIAGTRVRLNVFDHLNGHGVAVRLIRDQRALARASSACRPSSPAWSISATASSSCAARPAPASRRRSATLIDVLDQRRAAHVITLEDPIEYRFAPRRCLDPPARARHPHPDVRGRAQGRAARGARRDPARRAARQGHDRRGADRRRDRPPRARDAARAERGRRDRSR